MIDIRRDLARNTLAILCIIGLIGLSLWVLRPFLAATVWAAMLVVATWPLFRSLELRLGGRRGLRCQRRCARRGSLPACRRRIGLRARHAINAAWNRGGPEEFSRLMGCHLESCDKPTNCELLSCLVEALRYQKDRG